MYALIERKAAHQNKNLYEELKQGQPAQLRSTMLERLTSPSHRIEAPSPSEEGYGTSKTAYVDFCNEQ